ncbi:hypothetical protein ACFX11_032270 [Malus domestica]
MASIRKLVDDLKSAKLEADVDIVVAPPFLYLDQVKSSVTDHIELSGQSSRKVKVFLLSIPEVIQWFPFEVCFKVEIQVKKFVCGEPGEQFVCYWIVVVSYASLSPPSTDLSPIAPSKAITTNIRIGRSASPGPVLQNSCR